jgi:hypothetical protein
MSERFTVQVRRSSKKEHFGRVVRKMCKPPTSPRSLEAIESTTDAFILAQLKNYFRGGNSMQIPFQSKIPRPSERVAPLVRATNAPYN